MRNLISIKNSALYQIEIGSGQNSVIVSFLGVTTTINYLEIYKGDEFYSNVECTTGGGVATAEIPIEIFTGSNIHFRLIGDNVPAQFYHVVYDTSKELALLPNNYVMASNNVPGMFVLNDAAFGSYAVLSLFTYGELEAYTYDELRGGKVAEN